MEFESNFDEIKGLNMSAKLMTEFRNDPLYRMFVERDRENDLFEDFILQLEDNKIYSTPQVSDMFSQNFVEKGRQPISVSNLRHYITALEDYISPIGAGRLIKLNYESIFRLHMIFSLKDEYSVPMLQQKLVGKFKQEEKGGITQLDPQAQMKQAIMESFVSGLMRSKLLKFEGTDPSNLEVTLNEELISTFIQQTVSGTFQPLLEGKNQEIKDLNEKLDRTTKRMEDRFLSELNEDRLYRKAEAEWHKLSFIKRMGKDREVFIEEYVKTKKREKGEVD